MATAARPMRSGSNRQGSPGAPAGRSLGSFKIPLALTVMLLLLSFTPRVQASPMLAWSFWGACVALLLWQLFLFIGASRAGESHEFSIVLRPQHYIQTMVQISLYAYWGYYWRPVYEHFWLICGQLLFAYSFDMLLSWSRRRDYTLGFGPFPIILSINLFIWFRDDWFYLQFLMIAVGFMGKEYVRWQREGRNVHIFNPSALLAAFSHSASDGNVSRAPAWNN